MILNPGQKQKLDKLSIDFNIADQADDQADFDFSLIKLITFLAKIWIERITHKT